MKTSKSSPNNLSLEDIKNMPKSQNAVYMLNDILKNHGNNPTPKTCNGCEYWPKLSGCEKICNLFNNYKYSDCEMIVRWTYSDKNDIYERLRPKICLKHFNKISSKRRKTDLHFAKQIIDYYNKINNIGYINNLK